MIADIFACVIPAFNEFNLIADFGIPSEAALFCKL